MQLINPIAFPGGEGISREEHPSLLLPGRPHRRAGAGPALSCSGLPCRSPGSLSRARLAKHCLHKADGIGRRSEQCGVARRRWC